MTKQEQENRELKERHRAMQEQLETIHQGLTDVQQYVQDHIEHCKREGWSTYKWDELERMSRLPLNRAARIYQDYKDNLNSKLPGMRLGDFS